MGVRILVGHVIDQLRTIADESVHMVVTSPPYFGLRSYGTPPTVWGGDPDCEHQWRDATVVDSRHLPEDEPSPKQGTNIGSHQRGVRPGATCALCSAWNGDLGLEPSPALFIEHLVMVFREVRRVLRKDGTCWLNLGDSYVSNGRYDSDRSTYVGELSKYAHGNPRPAARAMGLKPKDLMMIPARVAIALQDDGWYLRSDIIWSKSSPMPESVTDRPTAAHEHVFLLSKSARYFFDAEAVKEEAVSDHDSGNGYQRPEQLSRGGRGSNKPWISPQRGAYPSDSRAIGQPQQNGPDGAAGQRGTRNLRNVWHLGPEPFPEAHFAVFPSEIPKRAILAGTSEYGVCGKCGAPWVRLTKTDYDNPGNRTTNGPRSLAQRHETAGFAVRLEKRVETLGWQPTCSCGPDAGMRQAVVLDPFAGAFTSCLVADRLKRDAIGIELSPTYAEMGRKRLIADAGLFADIAAD